MPLAGFRSARFVRFARALPVVVAAWGAVLSPCFAPAPLVAVQDAPAAGPAAGVDIGSLIRVRTTEGLRLEGRLLAGDGVFLGMGSNGRSANVPVADVDALWRAGRATGRGAWIGALAVGVPATGFAALLCDALSEGTGCDDWDKVALFGLTAAAVGGAGGALIGAFVRTWDLRWSRAELEPGLGTLDGHPSVGISIRI